MTQEEIYKKLLNYNSSDRIQLVRNEYKGTNDGFNEQLTNIINDLQKDYDFKYFNRLNDLFMMLDKAENENDLNRINNIESQIESHEKTIDNPFLISLRKEIKVYINQTGKQDQLQKNDFDLTIENLLKSGCNVQEANLLFNSTGDYNLRCNNGNFYVSKLENKFYTGIEYYRKVSLNNGSLLFPVNCPDLIPEYYNLALYDYLQKQKNNLGLLYNEFNQTEKFILNEIQRSNDIIENANESFLKRTQHIFESKELLVNVYQSYIYFLEQLKQLDTLIPEKNQQNEDVEEYLQAYKQSVFNTVIDKQSSILYYGKVTADVLEQRNKEVLINVILKERSDLLSKYNKRLYFLSGNVMQLFKAVNDYSKTGDSSFKAKIKIKENEIISSLDEIKEVSKVIKQNILNDESIIAQKIKDYCILMFTDCIDLLSKRFGVDIYKSPLNTHFENVKEEFIKSINYEQLKIINELSKSKLEAPQKLDNEENDVVLLKNENVQIFKNDFGFTLFTKMFELYKTENKDLANFSFLFFAMEADFLVCSQADFVKFIETEKYNINITKIDSRQWYFDMNNNKKSKLYNSIKQTLQLKHDKSTF